MTKSTYMNKHTILLFFCHYLSCCLPQPAVSCPSAVTLNSEPLSPHLFLSRTHTPGSYLPSPLFAAHLSPNYETHASWNIHPPRQPLNSHQHETTSTTKSPRPSLPPLPSHPHTPLSNSQNPPYGVPHSLPSAGSLLLFLLVSHVPAQCIYKPSFMLLSASHVAGIIPLWWITHVCTN